MKTALLFLGLASAALAQQPYSWQTQVNGVASKVMVPSSTTTMLATPGKVLKIHAMVLRNITNASATVTITDIGSDCNGSPCYITPGALTIPANTIYTVVLNGEPAVGGISWSASAANAIVGWIGGGY